jgi:hypothetical protein
MSLKSIYILNPFGRSTAAILYYTSVGSFPISLSNKHHFTELVCVAITNLAYNQEIHFRILTELPVILTEISHGSLNRILG